MVTGGSTGWRLEIHESLPSTSDLCITRAEAGEEAGLAVLARRQTHGRGSRGRSWTGQTGNLALSVLLRPAGALHQPALWPFLAALSLHQALGGGSLLQLKWPNDILLGHAKLARVRCCFHIASSSLPLVAEDTAPDILSVPPAGIRHRLTARPFFHGSILSQGSWISDPLRGSVPFLRPTRDD